MAANVNWNLRVVVSERSQQLVGLPVTTQNFFVVVPQHCVPLNPTFLSTFPYTHFLVPHYQSVYPSFRFTMDPSVLFRVDEERSMSLLRFMFQEGLVASEEEEHKRRRAIDKLRQIVVEWAKRIAWQRQLPKEQIASASAKIFTYGSYGLGAHGPESDVDALCVGPFFANIAEDFFVVLRNMLTSRCEVEEIHCVKTAKVPLMRFKFDGVSFDLPYAQLQINLIPEDVDVLNPLFLTNIDETSWKSLSGVRANKGIIQLVPNLNNFQAMLRCVKLWAKRRGVYGNLFGFFGGVHLAILAAFICQKHPHASLNTLISDFFKTFAFWPWPTPVILEDGLIRPLQEFAETWSLMPIQLPFSLHEYCNSNITRSTFYRIRTELSRGFAMTRDLLQSDFEWGSIFESFPYSKRYSRFVKIYLAVHDKDELGNWVGWVKSRFRCLIVKLEEIQGNCDPNPTEYVDINVPEPHVVFYWGLQPDRSKFRDIKCIEEEFVNTISSGYELSRGKMVLSIVQASQLPKQAETDTGRGKDSKACWKIVDSNQKRIPVFSPHLPNYLLGYKTVNGGKNYRSEEGV